MPNYFTVTPVLGPTGALFMEGRALNDFGAVAGLNGGTPFLWNAGSYTQLFNGQGDVRGLNNSGEVVGAVFNTVVDGQVASPAVRWQNGTMSVLSPLDASGVQTNGLAYAINDSGFVAGANAEVGGPNASPNSPTLWGPDGAIVASDQGFRLASLNALNIGAGAEVVAGQPVPAVWSANGGLLPLAPPGGAPTGAATDINASGVLVGSYNADTGGDVAIRPFVGHAGAGLFALSVPFGSFFPVVSATAAAINDANFIVGSARYLDSTPPSPALRSQALPLLWDPTWTEAVDLSLIARMPAGGTLNSAGFWDLQAVDINARGQVLVTGNRLTVDVLGETTLAGYESFVLSPCTRCGQILPNPNPGGAVLDVGPDWVDAHNALAFTNNGNLIVGTSLDNRADASINNASQMAIVAAGSMFNQQGALFDTAALAVTTIDGHVTNEGTVRVDGLLRTRGGAEFFNRNIAQIRSQGHLWIEGGSVRNRGLFVVDDGEMVLSPGTSFVNMNGSDGFFAIGAQVVLEGDFTAERNSKVVFEKHAGILSDVTLRNATMSLEENSHLDVVEGSLFHLENARLLAQGAHIAVKNGSKVDFSADSDLTQNGGTLVIEGAGGAGPSELNIGDGTAFLDGDVTVGGVPTADGDATAVGGQLVAVNGRINVEKTMTINESGTVDVSGIGSALNVGPTGSLVNAGSIILGNDTEFGIFGGNVHLLARSVARIGDGGPPQGPGSFPDQQPPGMAVLHAGTLTIDRLAVLQANGGYKQESGVLRLDGSLNASTVLIEGGEISGDGTLAGDISVQCPQCVGPDVVFAPRIRIGHSPGTLTIDGNLTLGGATMELEVGDYRTFDRLEVTGTTTIDALNVVFTPYGDYQPDLNDSLQWLHSAGGVTGLENAVIDTTNLPGGWQLLSDGAGRLDLWNEQAFELPAGGVTSFFIASGSVAYLSAETAGAGYEAEQLEIAGSLAVRPAAMMHVQSAIDVDVGGRLTNRGQIDVGGRLTNAGRVENREDGQLAVHGSNGLTNHDVFLQHGRLDVDATVKNSVAARFDNDGTMTANQVRNGGRFDNSGSLITAQVQNDGQFIVSGTLLTSGIDNNGRFEVGPTGRVDVETYSQVDAAALTVVDGELGTASASVQVSGGGLEGNGHVHGILSLGGAAATTLRPGGRDEVGTLTVDSLVLNGPADIEIDIASATSFDHLMVLGGFLANSGGGHVKFRLLNGFLPAGGSTFSPFSFGELFAGSGPELFQWSVFLVAADHSESLLGGTFGHDPSSPLHFAFDGTNLSVAAVPLPGTLLMMASGLAAMGGWTRSSRRYRQRGAAEGIELM